MTVETLQHQWELDQLVNLATTLAPERILEIGCWHGGTLQEWIQLADTVVAIDDQMRGRDMWQQQADEAGVDLHLLHGRSQEVRIVAEANALSPYDMVFIDADHLYQAVNADWLTYSPLVKPGGIVAFHDIRPDYQHGQVDVLWRQIRKGRRSVEFVDWQDGWGGIGVLWM